VTAEPWDELFKWALHTEVLSKMDTGTLGYGITQRHPFFLGQSMRALTASTKTKEVGFSLRRVHVGPRKSYETWRNPPGGEKKNIDSKFLL
jgi:hypothetical protein